MAARNGESGVRKTKEYVMTILIVGILIVICYVTGIGCPIKWMTGISCPGCGMSRAWMEALKLNMEGAMEYHPMFWALPVVLILWFVNKRIPHKLFHVVTIGLIIAFVGIYIFRLISPGDLIVNVDIHDGWIGSILSRIPGR